MSCCVAAPPTLPEVPDDALEDLLLSSRDLGEGIRQIDLSVPEIHCAGCIASIEKMFRSFPGVTAARVNLSLKRVSVKWRLDDNRKPDFIGALKNLGYDAHLFAPEESDEDPEFKRLMFAMAVAGFAAMNIMLLSVSVWSGAEGSTRQSFHWLSAIIAFPAIVYSGGIFFASAWSALKHGRSNMDVPISVGVLLAFGLSLYDTLQNAPHAYFDAATSLLFFLLIGRTLDHTVRRKARSAVSGLMRLMPRGTRMVAADGQTFYAAVDTVTPGTTLLVTPNQRIPLDGIVLSGSSDLDRSIVTGESAPVTVVPGVNVQAGSLNLTGELQIKTTRDAQSSFVSQMIASMLAAEDTRAGYRTLAERATAFYSPIVHTLAGLSLIAWYLSSGDFHKSITIAIAVLIITCPCALGLAVPMVQVAAAQRLFRLGILLRERAALERLATVGHVMFDKTGTLTKGTPTVTSVGSVGPDALIPASVIASHSAHPMAQAIAQKFAVPDAELPKFDSIEEHAGLGIEAKQGALVYRLGKPSWALEDPNEAPLKASQESISVLSRDGNLLAVFQFSDQLRLDGQQTIERLAEQQLQIEVLSGDRAVVVSTLASQLSITRFSSELHPADKVARIQQARNAGKNVLMVGDGLNDAPALAAANVSMVPSSAAEAGRDSADFVFTRPSLLAVPRTVSIARRAVTLIKQNFWLAVIYNALAIPLAVSGYVTPLVAAVSMSLSSILVVANSFRFRHEEPDR